MGPSASSLERISLCPPSAVLPPVDDLLEPKPDAKFGIGGHRFLSDVPKVGRDEALLAIEDEAVRAACEVLPLDELPIDGVAYAAEVSFAYNPATDTGRELGRDLERAYEGLRPGEIPGTADVVGLTADGEGVIIYDYKFGRRGATAAERNLQLAFLALAACRAYGRQRAHVAIISLWDAERPTFDRCDWSDLVLDVWADEIRNLIDVVEQTRAIWRGEVDGASLALTVGEHCRYCHARRRCSAWTAMITALARDPRGELVDLSAPAALDDDQVARAWRRLVDLQKVLEVAETVLKGYVSMHGQVDLGEGRALAQVLVERESVVGRVARELLEEKHGKEVADRASEWSVSKNSIEEALRKVAMQRQLEAGPGAKRVALAPIVREVLDELAARGGLLVATKPAVKEVRR
jgi:hypothetical protein